MSQAVQPDEKVAEPTEDHRQLEVTIYQIADDRLMKENREDGTGWEWCWADWQRAWMDATQSRFAYRCLPLTIANQTGLWVKNPVDFTATWGGDNNQGTIQFDFGAADEVWKNWITNIFGSGIITWNTPFLFRTRPEGSRLMVGGPANYFKDNAHALTAIIESDWMVMSFTMNWKLMRPNHPVRFEVGEPLFQAIPMLGNACLDLEKASVHYRKLDDDPEIARSYREWDRSRTEFTQKNRAGLLKPDDWQRDYFLGRDASGRQLAPLHMTKVKPPKVLYDGTARPNVAGCPVSHGQPAPRTGQKSAQEPQKPMRVPAKDPAGPGQDIMQNGSAIASAASPLLAITDEWRRWIAENLMLGASRDSILGRMIADGLPPAESAAEIERALESPYFKAAERLQNRLKKRDWMLATYRKLNRLRASSGEIERRHQLSRGAFLEEYYCANRPVIITGMMDDWAALRRWSLEYFRDKMTNREVDIRPGADAGGNRDARPEVNRRRMPFSQFIERAHTTGVADAFTIAAGDSPANQDALRELCDDIVPIPEYLDGGRPRDESFWFGPAGTITPFRHDLANTLRAQVFGRQRLLLAPSWDTPLMKNLLHAYSDIDGRNTPPTPRASLGQPQIQECILNAGELLFLPVGCWQFTEVLEASANVSFTNFAFEDNDYKSFYETYQSV